MPINNADLSAVLPVLTEARKPFDAARGAWHRVPQSARANPNTPIGRFAPAAGITLAQVDTLLQSLDAVYAMAGAKP